MDSELADLAGVPRFTLFGVIGGMAARGEHWRRGFEPLGLEQPAGSAFARESLYPDAAPCLAELCGRGYRLGLAGNASRDAYARLDLDVDFAADSGLLGVEKPSPEFFVRVAAEAGRPPAEIAYVGDRVDNDVEPALAAGMVAVHVRRGPWGLSARRARGRDPCRLARRAAGPAAVTEYRVGTGVDAHALEDGVPLVLGGVRIEYPRGLAGHSDGDVLAHALTDAVLGAAGLEDIGALFPSGDPALAGADSVELLRRAWEQARATAGARERGRRPDRRGAAACAAPARRCGAARGGARLRTELVAVRATTTDRLGFTGRGEGLAAQAVALLRR